MNKRFFSFLFLFFLLTNSFLFSLADWTVLNYLQVDNNLYNYALQDLAEMAAVGSNKKINIIAQMDIPNNIGTWRYRVDKGKLTLDSYLKTEMVKRVDQELIECAKWMVSKYPAKHYMIILSNHGSGILDPVRTQKGILFDDSEGTYLNNQQMAEALRQIKTNVLRNKIDILGMDACLMAMLEVGYQIKEYANLFVASQETESAYGWFYTGFLDPMSKSYCAPLQAAKYIVLTFEQFYKNKTSAYTQSAVDLNNIALIKQNVDIVIQRLNDCKTLNSTKVKDAIKKARVSSLEFALSDYIDLSSFYSELSKQFSSTRAEEEVKQIFNEDEIDTKLELEELRAPRPPRPSKPSDDPDRPRPRPSQPTPAPAPTPTPPPTPTPAPKTEYAKKVDLVTQALSDGINLIKTVVVANVKGNKLSAALGLSIYYPKSQIHSSYLKTKFAQESSWVQFLRENV